MGIGLAVGRDSPEESVDPAYDLTTRLLCVFEERFGSTNCRDLTGCDLSTEEGQRSFQDNQVFERCRDYVQAAADIARQLVEDCARSSEESA
jgi:putative redox-active protein with C_GCAxxG_C_C motif